MEHVEHMDHKRSPRYPSISLKDAIEAARLLWNKERRTVVHPEVFAKALGYSSVSGPVRTKLASLRQYDLLEKHADGVRISDTAMQVLNNAEGSADYRKAVQEAALSPTLFRELHNTHADASDDAIRSYLILKKGFSVPGARLAAVAYKDNLSLANGTPAGYNGKDGEHSDPKFSIGDYIQWESRSVLQMAEAKANSGIFRRRRIRLFGRKQHGGACG